jgi:hypothetical protein
MKFFYNLVGIPQVFLLSSLTQYTGIALDVCRLSGIAMSRPKGMSVSPPALSTRGIMTLSIPGI